MLHLARALLVVSLALVSTSAAAQSREAQDLRGHVSPTPAWLPRGVFLGTQISNGAVIPNLRIQWEFTFFQDRKDAWIAVLEGGVGWAAVLPESALAGRNLYLPVSSYYEHTAQVGFGYRNHLPGKAHWGFQVTGGPTFYGAHFTTQPPDRRTAGTVQGRLQIGYQLQRDVGVGLAVGYAEPFGLKNRSFARDFVGGVNLGFFADWR
ncbi:hypothetical protein EJ065_3400 [Corallococcus coralloides]|uniref:Outer membrane protein beta-barrel domain-containing protein n=1 Tax=Corallococcus coralloides TaxID=184914 RepID=A0A410RSY0_CORCK|nr:hypothetical protein [Corallococcus coralloides]QAT84962.1 hypothetical protein EJ065_3400 [Corallococcus coralloides]